MTTSSPSFVILSAVPLGLPRMEREKRTVEPTDEYRSTVEAESRELSDTYGLDYPRVRRILERLVCVQPLRPFEPLAIRRTFHRALKSFPPLEALALFEQADPRVLAARDERFAGLAAVSDLCCSLDEFAELIEAWLCHRYRDRDLLIETGWPKRPFARSLRLEQLSVLYPTKLPVEAWDPNARRLWIPEESGSYPPGPPGCDAEYRYTWSPVPGPLYVDSDRGILLNRNGRCAISPCSYEEASLVLEMSPELAVRVAADRERILRFRIELLELCASGIKARDPERLLPEALRLLNHRYTKQMLLLYTCLDGWLAALRSDPFYVPGLISMWHPVPRMMACGLSDFLGFVGLCEEELRVGALSQIRRQLDGQALALRVREGYFELAARAGFPRADALLDAYMAQSHTTQAFWSDFADRVTLASSTFFKLAPVKVSTILPREPEDRSGPLVANVPHPAEATVRRGPLLPVPELAAFRASATPPPLPAPADTATNIFRSEGKIWTIRYNGHKFQLVGKKGLQHIARVLELNGHAISALDLQRAVDGIPAMPSAAAYRHATAQQLEEDGLVETGLDNGVVATAKEESEQGAVWRIGLQELDQEEQAARDSGDADAVLDVQHRRELLKKEYSRNINRYGRSRESGAAGEKARKAVWACISRILREIAEKDAKLASHLQSAIKRPKGIYSYEPEVDIHWDV